MTCKKLVLLSNNVENKQELDAAFDYSIKARSWLMSVLDSETNPPSDS